jgi:DNA-binding transcriptional regulator LsrR (DeoR family)
MSRPEELRLIAKVASLYYEHEMRQSDIATQLDLSQAGVSRLLKRAQEENIVRITVNAPQGSYTELEAQLEKHYGLKEVIVVESSDDESQLLRNLGTAAAFYLETTLKRDETIGISSWSETLLAMTNALHPLGNSYKTKVVQILGGIGNPSAEVHATQLAKRLANLVHGEVTMLPTPGVVGSKETRTVLLSDTFVAKAVAMFDEVTLALVGIGSVNPSRLLASSGNVFTKGEVDKLRTRGWVGDICMRFFDEAGKPVNTPLNERVIGMSLEQLKNVPRTVGMAGGKRKFAAIKGALEGKLIHVLITDHLTAERLVKGK